MTQQLLRKNTKNQIIQILSEKLPLSAKQIHKTLKEMIHTAKRLQNKLREKEKNRIKIINS